MRIVSVNVSAGRVVEWRGRLVETGIFKEPVANRVRVRRLNLDGDRQADRRVHGGEFKAVYAYSAGHYPWWQAELARPLPYGMFGENLTVEEFTEEEVCIGDEFRAGSALLQAVQPRLPCFKLGIRFGDAGMVKRFMEAGRFGVYFRVVEEGAVAAGDVITRERRDPARFPVKALANLHARARFDPMMLRRALQLSALPPEWAERLRELQAAVRGADF
ncbi:MAG TPA: MOSC domain-containing protein [Gemmatimonadaceae bacterium]